MCKPPKNLGKQAWNQSVKTFLKEKKKKPTRNSLKKLKPRPKAFLDFVVSQVKRNFLHSTLSPARPCPAALPGLAVVLFEKGVSCKKTQFCSSQESPCLYLLPLFVFVCFFIEKKRVPGDRPTWYLQIWHGPGFWFCAELKSRPITEIRAVIFIKYSKK